MNINSFNVKFEHPKLITRVPVDLSCRPNWVGSPSSFRQLSFSSVSNRYIHNTQEVPQIEPQKSHQSTAPSPRVSSASHVPIDSPQNHPPTSKKPAWKGSPSSFSKMAFSKSVRYHPSWCNKQDIPPLETTFRRSTDHNSPGAASAQDDAAELFIIPQTRPPSVQKRKMNQRSRDVGSSPGNASASLLDAERGWDSAMVVSRPSRYISARTPQTSPVRMHYAASTDLKQSARDARNRELEQSWIGSPSSFRSLTYSTTSNRFIKNKQDIPEVASVAPKKYDRKIFDVIQAKHNENLENSGGKYDPMNVTGSGYGQIRFKKRSQTKSFDVAQEQELPQQPQVQY